MDKKIKVGIWGLGRAGIGMHLPEILKLPDQFEVVAGCDMDPDRRAAMAQKHPCRLFDDHEKFLADPEIELVSIATRSLDHATHGRLALEAGKYVLLEKPIAMDMQDAQQLINADRLHPGRLFLRYNKRFETSFVRIMEIIKSGVLGKIFLVKLHRHSYTRRADWQTIASCGGGQLNNWGPHIIDHALRFLDCPVADIWADMRKIAAAGDAEDHLKVILRGENGRVVDMEISGGAAISQPEYVIFGEKGALTCQGNIIRIKHIDPAKVLPEIKACADNPPLDGGYANTEPLPWVEKELTASPPADGGLWTHLYAAIRYNAPFPITIQEGIEVVRITDRIRATAAQAC